jgi:tetratricopeptide (TPR) repeat protein
VDEVLPGEYQETPYGQAFLVEKHFPADYQHGPQLLRLPESMEILSAWAGSPDLTPGPPQNFAFLDTETTGLAGGAGTFAFMVGVGRFEQEGFHLAQFFLRDPAEEPAMLAALDGFLSSCTSLVTFNGKSFDLPLLQGRFITNGWEKPWAPDVHLDLLHLARKLWRHRLPSRALGDLETEILQVKRTEEEVPGWMIPSMYLDYLRSRDARPIKGVFYHNEIDILSLAALLDLMADLLEYLPKEGSLAHHDQVAVARICEDIGAPERAATLYRHSLDSTLLESTKIEAMYRLSLIHKRAGNYEEALVLWRAAADRGKIYAHEEIAKYYEHTAGDFGQAQHWTEAALQIVRSPDFPVIERYRWLDALEHRLARLARRMS